jgi:hypothetical protein
MKSDDKKLAPLVREISQIKNLPPKLSTLSREINWMKFKNPAEIEDDWV